MNFPESLTVIATDSVTGEPVADVALVLRLKARRKNDYYVGPAATDSNGRVSFTRADCEKAIAHSQEMFLMDYEGDLLTCGPHLEIRLHRPENIQVMIRQYEEQPKFWGSGWDDPEGMIAMIRRARNAEFEAASCEVAESEIAKKPEVTITLKRK
jgi:hypothetical protein